MGRGNFICQDVCGSIGTFYSVYIYIYLFLSLYISVYPYWAYQLWTVGTDVNMREILETNHRNWDVKVHFLNVFR